MKHALLASELSKDPRTKVGAVIVEDGRIISTGRNGMVRGCNEKGMWDNKYPFVIHAEMNAALFSRREYLGGCQVYVTLSPCLNCLKHLFQLGVRVIYYNEMYKRFSDQDKEDLILFLNSINCSVVNHVTGVRMQEDL
jgi:dCMP deaminase